MCMCVQWLCVCDAVHLHGRALDPGNCLVIMVCVCVCVQWLCVCDAVHLHGRALDPGKRLVIMVCMCVCVCVQWLCVCDAVHLHGRALDPGKRLVIMVCMCVCIVTVCLWCCTSTWPSTGSRELLGYNGVCVCVCVCIQWLCVCDAVHLHGRALDPASAASCHLFTAHRRRLCMQYCYHRFLQKHSRRNMEMWVSRWLCNWCWWLLLLTLALENFFVHALTNVFKFLFKTVL